MRSVCHGLILPALRSKKKSHFLIKLVYLWIFVVRNNTSMWLCVMGGISVEWRRVTLPFWWSSEVEKVTFSKSKSWYLLILCSTFEYLFGSRTKNLKLDGSSFKNMPSIYILKEFYNEKVSIMISYFKRQYWQGLRVWVLITVNMVHPVVAWNW